MKGHQHIIEMRMERARPKLVFVRVDEAPITGWNDNPRFWEEYPYVYIAPTENIATLDFRFAVGLPVMLFCATTLRRLLDAESALLRCTPKFVYASLWDDKRRDFSYIHDTASNYTWQDRPNV